MYRVYLTYLGFFLPVEADSMDEAIGYAKEAGFSAQIHHVITGQCGTYDPATRQVNTLTFTA